MTKISIIGAGGFAKEVAAIIVSQQGYFDAEVEFFSENPEQKECLGFPVLHELDKEKVYVNGIGTPAAREKFSKMGLAFTSVQDQSAVVRGTTSTVGVGTVICANSSITENVHIGKHCLINLNVTVGHDTTIGDFTVVSPGANISGHVSIGSGCDLGTGCVILPKVKIGNNVVIGAGAVVTKNLPDNCTAVGVPAKVIKLNGNPVV